ncbi:MAG: NADH-quinone oxidoreductase subunit H [Phycisphaerae bacterium]|nr:NADH-quinone oxidoreductase subunit H [Phycisphaerae bacterium]
MIVEWVQGQAQLVFSCLLALVVVGVMLLGVAYSILAERWIAAWVQDRRGPNRAGFFRLFGSFHFWGLGQPIADGGKFFLKEDIIPDNVDKPLFILGPATIFIVALVGFAVIPWGGQVQIGDALLNVQVANPDIGLLYVLGVGSLGVYGVVLGGYASNNKYSFFGGIRATAQMLSYEIPMGLAILVVVLATGQLRLEEIVLSQMGDGDVWNVVRHPLACFLLVVTLFAETSRTPFDMPEAEQELVGGFHTEYSSMKFALFFLAEYAHMITGSAFLMVLFFGGWHIPFVPGLQPGDTAWWAMLLKMLVMAGKIALMMVFYIWVRWTLPRLRFDQLMRLAWKGLVPLGLGLIAFALGMLYIGKPQAWVWTLVGNVVILATMLGITALIPSRVTGRQYDMPELPPRTSAPASIGGP